jgi:glycosyltransferase involved in cell wall biosynthesis
MNYKFNTGDIVYSIVIPIYNQENIIIKNLQSIINYTLGNFEIIIILDFCFDNTEQKINNYFDNYINNNPHFIQLKIYKNTEKPLFETKCDNIGFKESSGKYCLEIQADMEMTENGYNIQLTKPFILLDNVIAVSGRCAHNLFDNNGIGKLGNKIETSIETLNINKNNFYVYETCNRGPLLIDLQKLKEMNYLDEENYFLDDSDHDLMVRSFIQKKYICGYVPIDFNSPLQNGSTRNSKYIDCAEFWINKNEKDRLTNLYKNKGLNKYKNIWVSKQFQIYDITNVIM